MNAQATIKRTSEGEDNAKRRQIIDGARKIFLARGFDAASMSDIARSANVSKGTLYVYFDDKEQLFQAIVEEECLTHAEGVFNLDPEDHDVEQALTRLGTAYVEFLCRPEKASSLRTVIAIADRMPEIGKVFYETGPACGIGRTRGLSARANAGWRALSRQLRGRRRPVHGCVPIDAVQAGALQLQRGTSPATDRACGADCRADIPRGIPCALIRRSRSHTW